MSLRGGESLHRRFRHQPVVPASGRLTGTAMRRAATLEAAFSMVQDPKPIPARYLRTKQAALFLGLGHRTLEKHRTYGTGPVYHKIGGRVLYAIEDLAAWVRLGEQRSTSDPGAGAVRPAVRRAAVSPAYRNDPPKA